MKILALDEYIAKRIQGAKRSLWMTGVCFFIGGLAIWHLFFSPFNSENLPRQVNKVLAKQCQIQDHLDTIKPATDLEHQLIEQVNNDLESITKLISFNLRVTFDLAIFLIFIPIVSIFGSSLKQIYTLKKIKKLNELQNENH